MTQEYSIIISGFGGQGTLFAGQLLAYAAMDNGYQVTWIPSYGPEMRGGTAHCTTIISNSIIGSPVTRSPYAVIGLNLPSVDKYEKVIPAGGILIANQSLMNRELVRSDIKGVLIPANEIAEQLGNKQMTNMVTVGALLAHLPVLSVEALEQALKDHLPPRKQQWLPANVDAMRKGFEFAQEAVAA
ncbi:MAG TPA: 2-oxoacid:ferredoxin oxidoreductase subunit gamma [Chloroflexi bacterium]|nr:2-oxoacid:ferredoxin oxidoreductase subunit gamma [Chloroflexota bacterium]